MPSCWRRLFWGEGEDQREVKVEHAQHKEPEILPPKPGFQRDSAGYIVTVPPNFRNALNRTMAEILAMERAQLGPQRSPEAQLSQKTADWLHDWSVHERLRTRR